MSEVTAGEVCIANIGPRQRRRRMLAGVVSFAVAAAIFAALAATGVHRWWRLVLCLPLYVAAAGWFQARDKT